MLCNALVKFHYASSAASLFQKQENQSYEEYCPPVCGGRGVSSPRLWDAQYYI